MILKNTIIYPSKILSNLKSIFEPVKIFVQMSSWRSLMLLLSLKFIIDGVTLSDLIS
jgi:hypothetical protein